jgi:hypothetical protein
MSNESLLAYRSPFGSAFLNEHKTVFIFYVPLFPQKDFKCSLLVFFSNLRAAGSD